MSLARFKMKLRSTTGKLIHVALGVTLFLCARESALFALLLVIDLGYLFRRERLLFWFLGFAIIGVACRYVMIDQKREMPDAVSWIVTVAEVETGYLVATKKNDRFRLYFAELPEVRPGAVLEIKGRPFFPDINHNPHNVNYRSISQAERIRTFIQVKEVRLIKERFHLGLLSFLAKQYVTEHFHPDTTPWILCLVFGDDSLAEPEDVVRFRQLGISHMFAISGMHIGVIVLFLDRLLSRLYCGKRTHHLLVGGFLLLYNILTGFLVSVFRASLQTASFFLINDDHHRLSRLDIISLIFLGLLIWNPYLSSQLGFQLSFLVSFCLLLARPLLQQRSKIISLIQLTGIANLFALPIVLEANKGIGVLTLLANLVFLEMVGILLLPGAFLTLFLPFLDWLYRLVIKGFLAATRYFSIIDLWLHFNYPAMWMKACHVVLAWALFLSLKQPKRLVLLGECWIVLGLIAGFRLPITTKITMMAVGCADSLVITRGHNAMLIDTGSNDDYDTILNYLRGENIRLLDLVVITHWHEDHAGELSDLREKITIRQIISGSMGNTPDPSNTQVVSRGDVIVFGELQFEVLSGYRHDPEENNNSLVLSFVIHEDRWLLMGDAEEAVERELLEREELEADIIKVGHHGSITSSTPELVDRVQARVALIPVGRNGYGFPSDEVIDRYRETGTTIFRTDQAGAITFTYGLFMIPWIETESKNWIQEVWDYSQNSLGQVS